MGVTSSPNLSDNLVTSMADTFAPLAAELRTNRGSRIRTNSDIHYLVRRMVRDIVARIHDAGTDLTKLSALHSDLATHEVDFAAAISGVTPQEIRPDRNRLAQPGDIVHEDEMVARADGTLGPRDGAMVRDPALGQGDPRQGPDGPAFNPDGTVNQDRSARNPDGSLKYPDRTIERNPDGTPRYPAPAYRPTAPEVPAPFNR